MFATSARLRKDWVDNRDGTESLVASRLLPIHCVGPSVLELAKAAEVRNYYFTFYLFSDLPQSCRRYMTFSSHKRSHDLGVQYVRKYARSSIPYLLDELKFQRRTNEPILDE